MTSALDEWQRQLEKHFSLLHQQRESRTLFALEHGLEASDIESLSKAIREHIADETPSRLHALVWVVYATEVGYDYSGDEYWQTFEDKTEGWNVRGDREWLRDCFRWFSKKFGGVVPSGDWATHFSIISWPITHAVLPRDLQRQLVRILYDLRHSFSGDLFESPRTLGEFIAARSWDTPSRFQNLVEEPQLIGQIAAALLLEGEFGTKSLLYPATLKRISADLNSEQITRSWLRTARRVAHDRAKVRGLAFVRKGIFSSCLEPHEARAEIAALGIEPKIILRPKNNTQTLWEARLEIPDLTQLLTRFPKSREVLTQSRCTVAGSAGRPLARGQCLFGSQQITLKRWPSDDEILLQFDKRDEQLEALFRTECLIRPGPVWLFRITSDGIGHEIRKLRVRPGQSYILVRKAVAPFPDLPSASLECEGVTANLLEVPKSLDSHWEEILQRLRIKQSKSIDVWPAGLMPAEWDNDGGGEWLATEKPCLAVRLDHSAAALSVSLGVSSDMTLAVNNLSPGAIAFVELPELPVGLHTIRFSTKRIGSSEFDVAGDFDVIIRIRESRSGMTNRDTKGLLFARIEPINPTLEQLWEGRVDIAFQGPTGREVSCKGTLTDSLGGGEKSISVPPLTLPFDAHTWTKYFSRNFKENNEIAMAFELARTCELRFAADELGSFTLRCERKSTALRWILQRRNGFELRLLHECGTSDLVQVSRRLFERPQNEDVLPPSQMYTVPSGGGMYVCRFLSHSAAIIVPPNVQGLGQFSCNPNVRYKGKGTTALSAAWSDAELWTTAKVSGDMFGIARQHAVRMAIHRDIIRLVCGDRWFETETAYDAGKIGWGYLYKAIWKNNTNDYVILEPLRKKLSTRALCESSMEFRIREIERVAKLLVGSNSRIHTSAFEWIAELALRIVSDPAEVKHWAGNRLDEGLGILLEIPTLVRVARLVVVVTNKQLNTQSISHELYSSWRWR